ncbi:MAG: homoserine kinase [Actinomycetota bacterium]|jgi:homoserine kinase|nr:homoserine kinase [Actinomycetota bacterium]
MSGPDRPRTATVRVAATSANLGPGFDCLGLALDLHDDVVVTPGDRADGDSVDVTVTGEGAGVLPADSRHLVARAVRVATDALGHPRTPLSLTCTNRIPHGRGLGSSAAAVVAGLLAGRALVPGGRDRMTDDAVLALACELEGHPDNAAACLLGGLTLAWADGPDGPDVHAIRLELRPDLRATALVPSTELATETSRGLLPASVPHADAAHAAGRAALLVAALTGVPHDGLLLAATEDRLHQGYREPAMPATLALVAALRSAGQAAVVSGAGPTVLVLATGEAPAVTAPAGWRVLQLAPDRAAASVVVD